MSTQNIHESQPRQLPKTYFDLVLLTGSKGPYQRNLFLIFFLNWLVAGFLVMQTSFLFMNQVFDCQKSGFLIDDCHKAVCSLDEAARSNFQGKIEVHSLSIQFGPFLCQQESTISIAKTMIYVGIFCGYIFFLFFTDNFGRKYSMLMAWGSTCLGVILLVASQNMVMACIALFIAGGGCESAIRINMAVFGQVVDYYLRQSYSVALEISFGLAGILIALIYMWLKDWWKFNMFIVLPISLVLMLLFIFYFEETPKFLLRKGIQPALKAMNRIGKINLNRDNILTEQDLRNVLEEEGDDENFNKIITPIDIFRFKSLRLKSICCCFVFFFITFLYFGPVFLVESLGFNAYVSQIVVSASELIAYPVSFWFVSRIPRVKCGVICFGTSAVLTGILVLVEKPANCDGCFESYLEIICVFGSRFLVSFYFSIFFLFVNELYPLRARGMGFGIGSAAGAVGSSIGPTFLGALTENGINPQIFMTLFAFLAIMFLIFLPETHNMPLETEIEEIQEEKNRVKSIKKQSQFLSIAKKE